MRNTEGRHQNAEEKIRLLTRRVETLEGRVVEPGFSGSELWKEAGHFRRLQDEVTVKIGYVIFK